MSAAVKKKNQKPVVAAAIAGRFDRRPFAHDAALTQPGSAPYRSGDALSFAEAMADWRQRIAADRLFDVAQPSLHELSLDPRDGAIVRRAQGGGLCYTPFAWSQLVSLMKTGAPMGLGNVMRWQSPLTRSHGWDDVTRASQRPRDEEALLRCFHTTVGGRTVQAARAVVSGRYAKDFDDECVLDVIAGFPERPVSAMISRQWIVTHGAFTLDASDEDVAMGFYLKNSEVGGASMEMTGTLFVRALDATIQMPSGAKFDRLVSVASDTASAKRRHTLPRYGADRSRLTPEARTKVAGERIAEDVERALEAARLLVAQWRAARKAVNPLIVPLCKSARLADGQVDEGPVMVLADMLMERGLMVSAKSRDEVMTFASELAGVIADDERLRRIPHGSVAHMAAALALVAQKDRAWEQAVEIQRMSGRLLVEMWS